MRICIVSTSFPRSKDDYAGVFVERLCSALVGAGLEVDVVAPDPSSAACAGSSVYGVYRFRYFFPRRLQRLAYGPGGIPANLRRQPWLWALVPCFLSAFFIKVLRVSRGAHLIHAQWVQTGLIAWLAGCFRGIPFVVTLRGSDAHFLETGRGAWGLFILRRAAMITTVNQGLRERLIARGISGERVVFIRNGVDRQGPRPERDVALPFRLLFVGSLLRLKGVHLLIDALGVLARSSREVRLILIGDGEERARLEERAKRAGVDAWVEFLGARPPRQIPDWMSRSDCLVLPSLSEGTSNVVLEAMASGLPVIASGIPGMREIVQDGISGFLIDPQNPRDLAEKVLKLAEDPALCRSMGEAGRRGVAGSGWDAVAASYREVYQKVCARGAAGASLGDPQREGDL